MTLRGIGILGVIAGISVALNLFLAGNMLGSRFRPPPPAAGLERRLDSFWQNMPMEDQPVAREIVNRHRNDILQKWRAARSLTQESAQALRADPFDESVAKFNFQKANERSQEFRAAMEEMSIEMASKISAEGRERLRFPMGGQ